MENSNEYNIVNVNSSDNDDVIKNYEYLYCKALLLVVVGVSLSAVIFSGFTSQNLL